MEIKSKNKIYRLTGVDSAMELLRPNATWELTNTEITKWEDERPCPTIEEIKQVQNLARKFEDSINTIWTKEQQKQILETQESSNQMNTKINVSITGNNNNVCEECMEIHGQENN